ncbi:MAG: hypothetical protein ABEJ95_07365 [Candidatus Nanohalobium sp.]
MKLSTGMILDPQEVLEKNAESLSELVKNDPEAEKLDRRKGEESVEGDFRLRIEKVSEDVLPDLGNMHDSVDAEKLEEAFRVLQKNTYSEDKDLSRFSVLSSLDKGIDPRMTEGVTDRTYERVLTEFEEYGLIEDEEVTGKGRAVLDCFSTYMSLYGEEREGLEAVSSLLDSVVENSEPRGGRLNEFFLAFETDKSRREIENYLDRDVSSKTVGNWYRRWREEGFFRNSLGDRERTPEGDTAYLSVVMSAYVLDGMEGYEF